MAVRHRSPVLSIVSILLGQTLAAAENPRLEPAALSWQPSPTVRVSLSTFEPGSAAATPIAWDKLPVSAFVLRSPGWQTSIAPDLLRKRAHLAELALSDTESLSHLVAVEFVPQLHQLRRDTVEQLVLDCRSKVQLPSALLRRPTIPVLHQRAGKLLPPISSAGGRPAGALLMAKLGHVTEIRFSANPATLQPGADLPVRVYADHEGVSGAQLFVQPPSKPRYRLMTEPGGFANIPIDEAGVWSLWSRSIALAADDGGQVVLFDATATFTVHSPEATR